MRICIIGFIETDYASNWRLFRALEAERIAYTLHPMPVRMSWKSVWDAYRFFCDNKNSCDVIWYSSFSHRLIPALSLMRRIIWPVQAPPTIYDAINSIYDTRVDDRQLVQRLSLHALYYYVLDWIACRVSQRVIADTVEQARYIHNRFGTRMENIHVVYAGCNRDIFYPRTVLPEEKEHVFTVSFHGKLIPGMLGTEYIMEAAKILRREPIMFKIFGKGSLVEPYQEMIEKEKLANVRLGGQIPFDEVPVIVSKSDVLLGAFGTTPKALKVIPIKVFEALALGKPVITGDTPAAREILEDKNHIVYAKLANPQDLAEKILLLRNNPRLREEISKKGHALYKGILSNESIGKEFQRIFNELTHA